MLNNKYRKELDYLHKKREARREKHRENARLILWGMMLLASGVALWWVLK
jgi:hypothetical protein